MKSRFEFIYRYLEIILLNLDPFDKLFVIINKTN